MNKETITHAVQYIDSWLQFRYEQENTPGLTVAIYYRGENVFDKAYGYADVERKVSLTPSHMFRVASHSKTLTATALLQLQESGKIRIDSPVVEYLPWLSAHTDSRWQNVTVRQILSHGAGIVRDGNETDYWLLERDFPDQNEVRREVLSADLVIDNNTKMKYSNLGYGLLGMVIEEVSGQSYYDYITKNIITELKFERTAPDYSQAINDSLVTGYGHRDFGETRLPIKREASTHALASATGLCANAADLCAFFSALDLASDKLLSQESKKEMQRMQFKANGPYALDDEGYGLGCEVGRVDGRAWFGHDGGFPGQVSCTRYFPESEIAVSVLANCADAPTAVTAMGIASALRYWQKNANDNSTSSELQQLEGRYMNVMGVLDIVAIGSKLVATSPKGRLPLDYPSTLTRIDDLAYRFQSTGSYGSEGETLRFTKGKNGTYEAVNNAGLTMWRDTKWKQIQSDRGVIEPRSK